MVTTTPVEEKKSSRGRPPKLFKFNESITFFLNLLLHQKGMGCKHPLKTIKKVEICISIFHISMQRKNAAKISTFFFPYFKLNFPFNLRLLKNKHLPKIKITLKILQVGLVIK